MIFGVLSGLSLKTLCKKPHMPHIWYQIKEEVVFFKMKATCNCQFLFVFAIELFVWIEQENVHLSENSQ